jgi:putative intracellular protease/amidase
MPASAAAYDVVTLPGLADPDDDDDPPIQRVRMVTERALEKGLPVLGICLGGQLLAQVLGGSGNSGTGRAPLARLPYVGSPGCRMSVRGSRGWDFPPACARRHPALPRCQRDVNQRPQPTATGESAESGSIQRDLRLDATRRNHLRRNGKEGVDGSRPSEGLKYLQIRHFCCLSGTAEHHPHSSPATALARC